MACTGTALTLIDAPQTPSPVSRVAITSSYLSNPLLISLPKDILVSPENVLHSKHLTSPNERPTTQTSNISVDIYLNFVPAIFVEKTCFTSSNYDPALSPLHPPPSETLTPSPPQSTLWIILCTRNPLLSQPHPLWNSPWYLRTAWVPPRRKEDSPRKTLISVIVSKT